MTKEEYTEYEAAVAKFFDAEGITNLSMVYDDNNYQEASFSTRPCECCHRHWHGDRVDANGYNPTTKEAQEYSVCEDCIYYAEHGRLDDMTMMDIDE